MQSSQFRLITGIVATLLVLALVGVGLLTVRSYPMAAPTRLPAEQAAFATPAQTPDPEPTFTATGAPAVTATTIMPAAQPPGEAAAGATPEMPAENATATPTEIATEPATEPATATPTEPEATATPTAEATATAAATATATVTATATATRTEIAIEQITGLESATSGATPAPGLAAAATSTATFTLTSTVTGGAVIQLTVEFVGATPTPTPSPTPTPYVVELPLPTPDAAAAPEPGPQLFSNANWVTGLTFAGDALWAATQGGAVAWNPRSGDAANFTTADGLTSNGLTAVVNCAAPGLGIVFGSDAGLQIFDTRTAGWRPLPAGGSGPHFNDVTALACDARTGTLVVGYGAHGLDVFNSRTEDWTLRDPAELTANPVGAVAVLPDGAIWAAAGATLFDLRGEEVAAYDAQNSPLTGDPIGGLALDGEGALWLIAGDRLLRRVGEEWSVYDAARVEGSFPAGTLTSVQSPRNGTIWIGSAQGEICRFDPAAGRCQSFFGNQSGMARGAVSALAATATGTAAYGTQANGVSYFDREQWQPLLVQGEGAAGNRVAALATDAAGFVWAATDGGVQQINPGFTAANWTHAVDDSGLATPNVQTIYADGRGGVWLGGDGASYFDGETWTHLAAGDGLVGPEVTAIVEDAQRRIWLGTRAGLSVWNGEDFFNLTRASGLPNDEITALATAHNGVWIGTNGGGLYRFRDNQLQVFTAENAGLPSDAIAALAVAPDGELFVGTDAGLARMVDGEVLPVKEVAAPVTSLALGPGDAVWVGTAGEGAAYFDGRAWAWLTEANGLPGRNIAAVAVDLYGTPWFGAATGGFVRGFTQTGTD